MMAVKDVDVTCTRRWVSTLRSLSLSASFVKLPAMLSERPTHAFVQLHNDANYTLPFTFSASINVRYLMLMTSWWWC